MKDKVKIKADFIEREYGVELDNEVIIVCDGEDEARLMVSMTATGKLKARDVIYGAWADVS